MKPGDAEDGAMIYHHFSAMGSDPIESCLAQTTGQRSREVEDV